MIKKQKLFIYFIILITFILCCGCSINEDNDNKYPKGGRDTVAEFGDRRFVILRGVGMNMKDIEWTLYDYKTMEVIDDNVDNYIEIKPYLYTISIQYFIKLNYENGEVIKSKYLKDFDDEDTKIFQELTKTKYNIIKK